MSGSVSDDDKKTILTRLMSKVFVIELVTERLIDGWKGDVFDPSPDLKSLAIGLL
jgi:hypothetical protein